METTLSIVTVSSIILTFMFLLYKTLNSKANKNTLPMNMPILGMLPAFLLNFHRIHDYLTEILQQSGGTFLYVGPLFTNTNMLITSDQANAHYVLNKNFYNFQKGSEFKKLSDIIGDGILSAEFGSWTTQRRTEMAVYGGPRFRKSVAMPSWNKVQELIVSALDCASEAGSVIDMQELLTRAVLQWMNILAFGHDPKTLGDNLPSLPDEKTLADGDEALLQRQLLLPETLWKIKRWLQIGKEKQVTKGMHSLDTLISACVALKFQECNEAEGKVDCDLLTAYMREITQQGGDLSDNNKSLTENMLSFFFEAKDTMIVTLTWFFRLLTINPEEQNNIRHELYKNSPAIEDVNKLNYLHGALCETIRLFPPLPLQHKASFRADVLPSGHHLSPNTKTILSYYSMGRTESIWGEDCLDFKPKRWISENEDLKPESAYKFVYFGEGTRLCMGMEIMKIAAATIISRFNIQLAEGHIISPKNSVVLQKKHGFKVNVTKCI